MKELLKRPVIKTVLMGILTILVTLSFSVMGNWDYTQSIFVLKISFVVISCLLYLFFLLFYAKHEVNDRRTNAAYCEQIETYENILSNIIALCQNSTSDINNCIHTAEESKKIDLNIWNFDKSCQVICDLIYKSVCEMGKSKKYAISYVRLDENTKDSKTVYMNAFSNQNHAKPTIFNKKRSFDRLDNHNNFHDLELFFKNSSDLDIIIGKDKIDYVFGYASKESREKNKDKYNQYVGIPIFCDNSKMVGLLQIVALKDSILGLNFSEVEEVASKFFVPYANIILVFHKMEKALMLGVN